MHNYILLFFRALAVTVTIETAVLAAFFFLRHRLSRGLVIRVVLAGVAASTITLPFVWFVFPVIVKNRILFLVTAELFAFAAEIPVIRGIVKTAWLEALTASLLANSISFLSGFLVGIT